MSRQVCGRTSNGIYVTCKFPLIVVEYVNRIAARFFEKGSLGQVLRLSVRRLQIVAFSSLSAAGIISARLCIDFQAEDGTPYRVESRVQLLGNLGIGVALQPSRHEGAFPLICNGESSVRSYLCR